MANILVCGANGQLGNELKVVSERYSGYNFIFTDINTLNITSEAAVADFVSESRPDWIINCAAYNLVDKAETEPDAANLINSTAVGNIAGTIKGTGCHFIHVSTDYVYSGSGNTPCSEDELPQPLSAYGRSKLAGEKQAFTHQRTIILRTSWLYSSFGSNFVKTIIKNAKTRESLNVVFDQAGTPTYAADLADAIMNIVSGVIRNRFALTPGIYNYSNEGVCSWFDFATEIVKETGLDCRIAPILTSGYPTPAKRPVYSVMDKTRIRETYGISIPYWRDSLKKCIELLK